MSDLLQGYKRNTTLGPAILEACSQDGMGWYGQWRVARALRRLDEKQWFELEQKCTKLATESGLPMGTDDIVAGCYTGAWGDGTFFKMLIDSLPQILEFIKALLPLFMLFATVLLCCGLFAGTASAGDCASGMCRAPVRAAVSKTKTVVVEKQVARTVTKNTIHRGRAVLGRIVFWR